MSSIPALKKKLKGITATKKLSAAMKTVSAVKFSRLNSSVKTYKEYAKEFSFLYDGEEQGSVQDGRQCVIVMASNRGLCGGFNTEVINFAIGEIGKKRDDVLLVSCGELTEKLLLNKMRKPDKCFKFSDTPKFSECEPLLNYLDELKADGKISSVKLIYPEYKNTITQLPKSKILYFKGDIENVQSDTVYIPDSKTVFDDLYIKGFRTIIFGAVLETALGAQAATLMTMRSAYDTATDYSESLEKEIHRKRQSEVTADVIETSAEHTSKEEYK